MANVVVVGMQWGDEGKGKIVDLLCPAFDAVVRYQGGNNAGHTVRFGERHFSLHLLPSGIVHTGLRCVLGSGMVVDPGAFLEELAALRAVGVDARDRLLVSRRAHALLPHHSLLDRSREADGAGGKIGTTARGIGPAYEMKAARLGIRLGELDAPDLAERLRAQLARAARELPREELPSLEHLAERCAGWARDLEPFLADTEAVLDDLRAAGQRVLFEGAQGTMLDLDLGTYPFVTSSSTVAAGACTGTGVPPWAVDGALGVLKAYTSRVGEGPFPTELTDERGERLRRRGNEYGTTTGRPRRCGWLDTVVARFARRVNGVSAVAVTKLDILDSLAEIPVCVAYRVAGEELRDLPPELWRLQAAQPVYRTLPGWRQDTTGALEFEALPSNARRYLAFLEEEVGAPACLISTGPRREETVVRSGTPLADWVGERLAAVLAERGA